MRKAKFPSRGLYAITPSDLPFEELYFKLKTLLEAGVELVQLRDKPKRLLVGQALKVRELCHRYGVPLIVNDDVPLAKRLEADGVHLGREDIPLRRARAILGEEKLIGLSCYDRLDLALKAQREGADYVAFGAFYPTPSKERTARPSPELLRKAKRRLKIPVVAIGGITPENVRPLLEAGADSIAAISGLFRGDPREAVSAFRRAMVPRRSEAPLPNRPPRAFPVGRTPEPQGASGGRPPPRSRSGSTLDPAPLRRRVA